MALVEVKSRKAGLASDQKRWVIDNSAQLRLPFKLLKIVPSQ